VLEFEHDVSAFMGVATAADIPATIPPGPSYIVAFAHAVDEQRSPLLVDGVTARILALSDGTRTASRIVEQLAQQAASLGEVDHLQWIENLFVEGLISLGDQPLEARSNVPADRPAALRALPTGRHQPDRSKPAGRRVAGGDDPDKRPLGLDV
jgi:hypothetical protein